ncbi:type I-F CRISPR-associated protein Csy1 [Azohydromonas lata]|uniref:type I-F CRISPR-associated protein Csy1 n=1 Tax=Azohydromonas lata TaxID=45677 RepID=UPI000A0323BF|nr:type I-F CRISPR-associated protein Csy1 [Azohydromonas lata]
MPTPNRARQAELASLVSAFLAERLSDKLEKLSDNDPKRAELRQQYQPGTWLPDAARRVLQLQAVTHSLKPMHPDARGTNLLVRPSSLPSIPFAGSHCLPDNCELDVVGNAGSLDVYKFLKLECDGKTLLQLAQERDADFSAVLSDDQNAAESLISAFASLGEPRGRTASHTTAKQIYWLIGDDPFSDASFHLLAPLYPTSLVHHLYLQLEQDRFGEAAKVARAARRERRFVEQPIHDYPDLAIRKLGGTKPQVIGQLNTEHRGNSPLLASLPPTWHSEPVRPLLRVATLFKVFGYRDQVRRLVPLLRGYLETDPARVVETRQHRAKLVNALVEEFIHFTAELRDLAEGWSQDADCRLSDAERCWLDPLGVPQEERLFTDDVSGRIAAGFANWLNEQLRVKLDFADPEFKEWRDTVLEEIRAYDLEVSYE